MEPVRFTKEQSSLISSIQYDEATWVLDIHMHNGNAYSYSDVGPETYAELMKADSKGSFYNRNIKGHFESFNHKDLPAEMPATIEGEFKEQLKTSVAEDRDPSWPPEDVMDAIMGTDALEVAGETKDETPPPVALMVLAPVQEVIAKLNDVGLQLSVLNKRSAELLVLPMAVTDNATHAAVQQTVKDLKAHGGEIIKLVDPVRDVFYKAYTAIQERQKAATEPLNEGIRLRNSALNAYETKLDNEARQRQRLADEEADRQSAARQKQESERLTLAALDDHLEAGQTAAAERLFEEPIQAPAQPVYAEKIYSEAPATKGVSKRKNWKGEVQDIVELILDVAEGIKHARANDGNNGGHAPISFLEADQSAINTTIKGTEGNVKYPGIRVYNDTVRSTRVGK